MRLRAWALMAMAALAGGCSSAVVIPVNNGSCIGWADNLKTLHAGDELPRVVQVLGMPVRSVRSTPMFGRTYDVMEYEVGKTACYQTLLDADEEGVLRVVFDARGGYVGAGQKVYNAAKRWTFWTSRTQLLLDPVVQRP